MECSLTKKITKVILPENRDGGQRIVIDCKHTLIGDNTDVYVDAAQFRGNNDQPEIEIFNLGEQESENPASLVKVLGDIVQVIPRDDSLDIEVVSKRNDSTVQAGDNTALHLFNEDNNRHDKKTSDNVHRKPKQRPPSANRRPSHNKRGPSKTKESVTVTLPPSNASKSLYKIFFEEVFAVLHPLRDDGKWDLFYDKLNEFRSQHGGKPEWDILLSLEQAQQMCYHSAEFNIEEAANILCETLKKIPERLSSFDSSTRQLCEGRAYCYLASVYRHLRGNFLGKADKCLEEAQKRLKGTNFLYDEATLYYEKASILLEFANAEDRIREYLDKCSQLCDEINKERKWDFVKKGRFAKLKKVMLLLNCSTIVGRKRKISDENLEEAKKCLDELENENNSNKEMPIGERLQCLLVKSDEAFRCGCHEQAKEIIEKAITLATQHCFDEKPALKRLEDLVKNMSQKPAALVQEQTVMNNEDESTEQCCSGYADISATSVDTE